MNVWTLIVLAVIALIHGYPDPVHGYHGWNSTSEADEFDDYLDEFEDPEEPFAPSERGKRRRSSSSLIFDFEQKGDRLRTYFSAEKSTRSLSQKHYKNGGNSLLWEWKDITNAKEKPKLTLDLKFLMRDENELKRGGFKFWIYKESKSPNSKMQIVFHGPSKDKAVKGSIESKPTDVNLDFKGWRGIWITYKEFNRNDFQLKKLKMIEFIVQSTKADKLYFDLIQFATSIGLGSRDLVVKKVGQSDTPYYYNHKAFWQQSLRWKQYEYTKYTETLENVDDKLEDIDKIEKRIENWYAKDDESIIRLTDRDSSTTGDGTDDDFDFNKMKAKRWKSLKTAIKQAHILYQKIDFKNHRPSLFPKRSDYGKEKISGANPMTKFGYVFSKILLPLSLECALMSRDVEVKYLAKKVCKDLTSDTGGEAFNKGIQDVAGEIITLKRKLKKIVRKYKAENPKNIIECPPVDEKGTSATDIEGLIKQFNDYLFQRIKTLLEYLQDQGIAAGSSLGTLDHEMNKIGSGFVHSVFLLRDRLRKESMFNDLVEAMKWYSDFNEIYQPDDDYVYDGTTTDRMRTILLYRLQIILMKKTKGQDEIHDLNHLKKWIKNALKINKGLGGVIKPDFTGYHHKTFYGSAYVPEAYHNAALVQYFLDGTSFELDEGSKANLRKALGVLRMVSVKYSIPNGICGRFPGYDRALLARMIPAYAYIISVHPKDKSSEFLKDLEMFLRLFDPKNPSVIKYLERGAPISHIYYWNTIGCLDVIKKVSTLKCDNNKVCTAEKAPSGHWSKNFAGLSIHRRNDWTVAAKGFGKYTWDFEGTASENAYGVFQSHGSLQISNSEESLQSYDVKNGWDWTKVPGATTVATEDFDQIVVKARNYNYEGFAGGVSFTGSQGDKTPLQGAFGMLFKQPKYKIPNEIINSPLLNLLAFRKSFFFYNNLIVCLGSDIKFKRTNVDGVYPQTTIFQDKNLDGNSKIYVGTKPKKTNEDYSEEWSKQKDPVILKDTKGNTYKIKISDHSTLKVKVSQQKSRKSNGAVEETSAWYGTAWIDHTKQSTIAKRSGIPANILRSSTFETISSFEDASINSEGTLSDDMNNIYQDQADGRLQDSSTDKDKSKYEYAIVIKGGTVDQLNKYEVIRQDKKAHIIQIGKVFGYSFFESVSGKAVRKGPIRIVNAPCMIMAEKSSETLRLAISNHDIGFEYDPENNKKATCKVKLNPKTNVFRPEYSSDVGVKTMFCVTGKASKIIVRLHDEVSEDIEKLIVNGEEKKGDSINKYITVRKGKKLIFSNLVNGFTTEVVLKLA